MDRHLVILVVMIFQAGISNTDPCEVHINITDVDLLTTHTYKEGQACTNTPSAIAPNWYRYIVTPTGAMATSCPDKTSCGGKEQIWINDTLPNYADGATNVASCTSTTNNCCDIKRSTLMKNCNSFYVVQLTKPPKCFTHYCFAAVSSPLVTVSTTQSKSITTSQSTNAPTLTTTVQTMPSTKSSPTETTTPTAPTSSQYTNASTQKATIQTEPSTKSTPTETTTTNSSTSSSTMSAQKTSDPTIQTSSAKLATAEKATTVHVTETKTVEKLKQNNIDKDKDESTALAAGLGATGFILIVASVFATLFFLYRTKKNKENSTHPEEGICPEREDKIKKPKFITASLKDNAYLNQPEFTTTFEKEMIS